MAKPNDEANFSTLEVVPLDGPTNAPELDFISTAPQLDQTLEAPQSDQRLEALQLDRFADVPEPKWSSEFPEVVEDPDESLLPWRSICGFKWKRSWVAIVILCLAILGVGLGIGLKNGKSAPSPASPTTTILASRSQITRHVTLV